MTENIYDFFCDVVLWFLLLMGLILIFIPSSMFRSISQMDLNLSPAVIQVGKWMAIIGAVGILFMSGRDKKNPFLRLALGAYDLYNITGWVSDILSYSRLLALGLATGVIASVMNQMGSMLGDSILGWIVFILVFVDLVISLTSDQSSGCIRAHLPITVRRVFGKFFEGGGKEFQPIPRKYKICRY